MTKPDWCVASSTGQHYFVESERRVYRCMRCQTVRRALCTS